jgi:RND family efflux transporter MFP subunit
MAAVVAEMVACLAPMNPSRPGWLAGLTALPLLAALASGCAGEPQVASLPPPQVVVSQPVERTVTEYFETTGRTAAIEEVEIRARVAGYLVNVNFVDGSAVKAGDVLFEIDPRPYEAAVHHAEGDLARWQAELRKADAEVARNRRLRPTGAASEKELETSIAAKETAEAEIVSARARLETARLDLEFTRIVAPIDGQTSRTSVTKGNLIQLGGASGASGSTALTTLVRMDPIYVYFDVDERTILRARQRLMADGGALPCDVRALNMPVEIGLADEQGFNRSGSFDFVDNRVDPSTGTMLGRAVFANADRYLTPGMFVRVRVPLAEKGGALLVTGRAIGTDQGNKYLLVVNDKNVVEYRPVTLGIESDGLRAVERGVAAGEWVITNGIQRVRPGVQVEPQRQPMVAAEGQGAPPPGAPAATGEPAAAHGPS